LPGFLFCIVLAVLQNLPFLLRLNMTHKPYA